MASNRDRRLSVTDLSERLQIPEDTIYQWNRKRTGPRYLRIGRHIRYRLSDVEAWEESKEQTGAA